MHENLSRDKPGLTKFSGLAVLTVLGVLHAGGTEAEFFDDG